MIHPEEGLYQLIPPSHCSAAGFERRKYGSASRFAEGRDPGRRRSRLGAGTEGADRIADFVVSPQAHRVQKRKFLGPDGGITRRPSRLVGPAEGGSKEYAIAQAEDLRPTRWSRGIVASLDRVEVAAVGVLGSRVSALNFH